MPNLRLTRFTELVLMRGLDRPMFTGLMREFESSLLPPKPSSELALALLADIRLVFTLTGATRLFSTQLAEALRELPDRPWSGSSNGDKPLTAIRLAQLLAALDIQPQRIRIGQTTSRGYLLSDFVSPSQSPDPDFEI